MSDPQHTMVTTTSYGSWLPGDARGYVQRGEILPGAPKLVSHAEQLLKSEVVTFSDADQDVLLQSLTHAAIEFKYELTDVSIESWHLHWIAIHEDAVKAMVGRLKNRMRQALDRGRIWTAGYHFRQLETEAELFAARNYIARHDGARIVDGNPVAPGSAGG